MLVSMLKILLSGMSCVRKGGAWAAFALIAATFVITAGPAAADRSELTVLDEIPQMRDDTPVPDDPNVVFYIQRSGNPNTVVYAARFAREGRLNRRDPVEVFWRRYNTTGEKRDLSYAERTFAWGIRAAPLRDHDNAFLVSLVSYTQRPVVVRVNGEGEAEAILNMEGRTARLIYAYVKTEGSGRVPSIVHVDIFGEDLETGEYLRERVTPDPSRTTRGAGLETYR